jgi:hypothetical protein
MPDYFASKTMNVVYGLFKRITQQNLFVEGYQQLLRSINKKSLHEFVVQGFFVIMIDYLPSVTWPS